MVLIDKAAIPWSKVQSKDPVVKLGGIPIYIIGRLDKFAYGTSNEDGELVPLSCNTGTPTLCRQPGEISTLDRPSNPAAPDSGIGILLGHFFTFPDPDPSPRTKRIKISGSQAKILAGFFCRTTTHNGKDKDFLNLIVMERPIWLVGTKKKPKAKPTKTADKHPAPSVTEGFLRVVPIDVTHPWRKISSPEELFLCFDKHQIGVITYHRHDHIRDLPVVLAAFQRIDIEIQQEHPRPDDKPIYRPIVAKINLPIQIQAIPHDPMPALPVDFWGNLEK